MQNSGSNHMTLFDAETPKQNGEPSENAKFVVNKILLWLILVPLALVLVLVLFGGLAHGEEKAIAQPCLIVKHKGTVGRRLIYFALIGVPIAPGANYDYVDSANFSNSKMSYKGKQLEQIQASGTHVIVLDKYTPDGVAAARQSCAANMPTVRTEPTKQITAPVPENVEHPIEGYTLNGPSGASGTGSADGEQTSLGDAARQAKAKKQQEPQEPRP
jgi:hypothetical protein